MKNKKSDSLVFLKGLTDESLKRPFILSSLQDFEGALLLVSDYRWPAALVLLWSACEKIIKASICAKENSSNKQIEELQEMGAIALQSAFAGINSALTSQLNTAGHDLRRLRNEIAHKGASPADDNRCLHHFFYGGVSYFESGLIFVTEKTIKEAMGEEGRWFWEIYYKTRRGVFALQKTPDDPELKKGMFYLCHAARKCLAINSVNRFAHPFVGIHSMYIGEVGNGDFEFQARSRFIEEIRAGFENAGLELCPAFIKKDEDESGMLESDMTFRCPMCGQSDGVIGFNCREEAPDKWVFDSLEAFCCLEGICVISGRIYYSRVFLKIFFEEVLTESVKKFLATEGGEHGYKSLV